MSDFESKRELMLKGSISKAILVLAAPIMFNNFIQTLYNLSDTYFVSQLGYEEVAAMTLVFPVIFLILSIAMGMNMAGTSLISQYIGSEQKEEADKVAAQLFSFLLVLSIFLSIIGYFLTPKIVSLMGGEGNILLYGSQYLSIMFLEMPVIFMFVVYNAIMQGQGNTFTPMILNVLGSVTNIILSPFLIFGSAKVFETINGVIGSEVLVSSELIPALGIRGAAIATLLSRLIFVIIGIVSLFLSKDGIKIKKSYIFPDKKVLKKLIKVGLPASIGQSGAALGFIILNMFVISYGDTTLAAFGIGNRINSVVMMPAMGIGNAIAPIIGQNLGAGNTNRAEETFKKSIIMSTVFMVIGGGLMFLNARSIVEIFSADDIVLTNLATDYLRLISIGIPLMGIFQILNGLFQGSGHTMYVMFMNMFRLWGLRIPMIWLLGRFTNLGSDAIWYSMVTSNLIICILGMRIYYKGKWKEKIVDEDDTINEVKSYSEEEVKPNFIKS